MLCCIYSYNFFIVFHMVWILGGIPSKDIFKWSYDAHLNYSESTEFYIHSLMSINKHRKCMKEFSKISYESFLSYLLYSFTSFYLQVVLETEITNKAALRLYENLGFVRDKRLFRYYLNGVDALRLKLWLRWIVNFSSVAVCTTENHHSFNKKS